MTPPKNAVNATRTTFRILEALQDLESAGVTEIANEIGVTKGTVHNHLSTLEHSDYVVKTEQGEYEIGFRFLDLAHHAKRRIEIYDLVAREVDGLAKESGEMALYTREEHGLGVCVYKALGDNAVKTPLYVGHRSNLHHTAVGKAILAHLPQDRVEAIVDEHGLPRQTEQTITTTESLFEELEEIRERGFAFNRGETIPGLVGVGCPVLDQDGDVRGAISIIGPTSRMGENRFTKEIPDLIIRSVNIIGINATSL